LRFLFVAILVIQVQSKPTGEDETTVTESIDWDSTTTEDTPTTVTASSDGEEFQTEMSIKVSLSKKHGTSEEIV
jgi:hypothetical protein